MMVRFTSQAHSHMPIDNKVAKLLTVLMFIFAGNVSATVRCGTSLLDEGDSVQLVLAKCGEPAKKISEGPALRNNGVPKMNAAKISIWVYGPHGGSYRYLRFVDDELVSIEMRRK
jgi:Protein of unknown function (DUF2845)